MPRSKERRFSIYKGTVNISNRFEMQVTAESSDTVFARIMKVVENAQHSMSKQSNLYQRLNQFMLISY